MGSELIYIMRLIMMNNSSGAWGCRGEEAELAGLPTLKPASLPPMGTAREPPPSDRVSRGEGGQLCRIEEPLLGVGVGGEGRPLGRGGWEQRAGMATSGDHRPPSGRLQPRRHNSPVPGLLVGAEMAESPAHLSDDLSPHEAVACGPDIQMGNPRSWPTVSTSQSLLEPRQARPE